MNCKYPVKVLHVVGTRPVGGIGTLLKNLNTTIDLRKFCFSYTFSSVNSNGDFDNYISRFGSDIIIFPSYHIKNIFLYLKMIASFYRENAKKYDIIHVHSANTGVLDLFFAKKYGIKVRILHSHSTKYSSNKIKSIRNYILQFPTTYLANTYFACSLNAAEFLFGKKSLAKVHIIHNAIFADKFIYSQKVRNVVRQDLMINEKCILIGHVGNFTKEKNHMFLIDIFFELLKISKNAKLLLVGDGEERTEIERKIDLLGLKQHVCLLGRRNDISNLLQAMDFFVFPSFFEGLPLTLIEAQASGLRCLVSNKITLETKITENITYLDISLKPEIWATILLDMANEKYIRKNMMDNIRKAGYDINQESKYLENLYLKLLEQ